MSRRRSKSLDLRQQYDTSSMRLAIDWCLAKGYPVRRCSPCQLRVGPINFWPDSGTVNFEASAALPTIGLVAFQRIVTCWFALSPFEQDQAFETLAELGVDALENLLLKGYLL